MKHLSVAHASTKLTLAKNSVADAVDDASRPGVANASSAKQVPVRHAEIHFLNTYVNAEYAKMTAELKRGKK